MDVWSRVSPWNTFIDGSGWLCHRFHWISIHQVEFIFWLLVSLFWDGSVWVGGDVFDVVGFEWIKALNRCTIVLGC